MDRIHLLGLRTFHAIVTEGTLRGAAIVLGVQASAVSQQLKQFETRLGAALFVRSTRSVVLTEAGQDLLERTRHLLSEADAAIEMVRSNAGATAGALRVTLPFRAWQVVVAPRLPAFHASHPEIELEFSVSEDLIDITRSGFHAGIRLGDHLENRMIAKAIGPPMPGAYVASPDYIEEHGMPEAPADLLRHQCIRHRRRTAGTIAPWEFVVGGERVTVEAKGRLILDDLRSVVDAALRGCGIGWTLEAGVREELVMGQLLRVLPGFTPERPRFYVYYPRHLRELARLRVFIDHLSDR